MKGKKRIFPNVSSLCYVYKIHDNHGETGAFIAQKLCYPEQTYTVHVLTTIFALFDMIGLLYKCLPANYILHYCLTIIINLNRVLLFCLV